MCRSLHEYFSGESVGCWDYSPVGRSELGYLEALGILFQAGKVNRREGTGVKDLADSIQAVSPAFGEFRGLLGGTELRVVTVDPVL